MSKFVGTIGFVLSEEQEPGLFVPTPRERSYRGDMLQSRVQRSAGSDSTNDDIRISNQISIIADPYARDHVFEMKYLKFRMPKLGGIWAITDATVQWPRIILTLGGVYSGIVAKSSEETRRDSGKQ